MPNNPVQLVRNDEDFLQAPEPGRKGPEKDFFEERDAAFAQHKRDLIAAVSAIEQSIRAGGHGPATYMRVMLREEALAKSYRPNTALLTPDRFPCVGAAAIGELFFFAPLLHLGVLKERIAEAEDQVEVKHRKRDGMPYRATTRLRSEVGAIARVDMLAPEDKRSFATAAAVQAFTQPNAFPGYLVELFEVPSMHEIATDRLGRRELFQSLAGLLIGLGRGAQSFLLPAAGRTPLLEVQLTSSGAPAMLTDLSQGIAAGGVEPLAAIQVDQSLERHEAALEKLAAHPLVRRIDPPLQLALQDQEAAEQPSTAPKTFAFPTRVAEASYPRMGIIDSGIAKPLEGWLLGRFDYLATDRYDSRHGSKIAGLAVAGQGANGPAIAPETDGCQIFDIPLYPNIPFRLVYRRGFNDFLEEMEQSVREAHEAHGVRVFNMSINAETEVQRYAYGAYAARIDAIADRHGVLIVNSAGNLERKDKRRPWDAAPGKTLAYFASRTTLDTILQPTETVRGVSVGALTTPGCGQVPLTPATYSRRGPGLQFGVKPDVAHYGGGAPLKDDDPTGLVSCDEAGQAVAVCGTSYAAPLVARTLAELDMRTEQTLTPRTLRALLLHDADMPEPLQKRGLKDLARQFVGFGMPGAAERMLVTDDHRITLVFESLLTAGQPRPAIMRFHFAWPEQLIDPQTRACSGTVKMTLVYEPPLDPAFGAEFARVNLDASLKQRQPRMRKDGQPGFDDQMTMLGMPKVRGLPLSERALIDHGLKWWPAKKYHARLAANGESSEWRLEVASLTRAEASFPTEGVPFALIVTIEDPDGKRPIFQTFRQYLQAGRAQVDDIRTAVRIRPRPR